MKNAIFFDLHGRSPLDLLSKLSVDRAIFGGDYDDPRLLEEILSLDMNKVVLIGNHDYSWAIGTEVISPDLMFPAHKYFELWAQHAETRRFVMECAERKTGKSSGLRVVEGPEGDRVVYVHAALVSANNEIPELWGRLLEEAPGSIYYRFSPGRVRNNFREMEKEGYSVMIRGHDPLSGVLSLGKGKPVTDFRCEPRRSGVLDSDARYIICVEEFRSGNYLVFEDETREFQFEQC